MTRAKNKEEWIKAWVEEAHVLRRAFQCSYKRGDLFTKLREAIDATEAVIAEIGEAMDQEGTWDHES